MNEQFEQTIMWRSQKMTFTGAFWIVSLSFLIRFGWFWAHFERKIHGHLLIILGVFASKPFEHGSRWHFCTRMTLCSRAGLLNGLRNWKGHHTKTVMTVVRWPVVQRWSIDPTKVVYKSCVQSVYTIGTHSFHSKMKWGDGIAVS
jgi:hypothetical protein